MGFIGSLEIRQIEKTCWIGEHFAQLNSYWKRFKFVFRFLWKICINKIFRIDGQSFSFHLLGSEKHSGVKLLLILQQCTNRYDGNKTKYSYKKHYATTQGEGSL